MARNFVAANNQYLSQLSGLVTAYPVVMAAWVRITALPPSSGNKYYPVLHVDTASTTQGFDIWFGNDGKVYASNDFNNASTAAGTMIVGSWVHLAAVFTSSSAMKLYVNGISTGAAVAPGTFPPSLSVAHVGYFYNNLNSPYNFYFNGQIAFPAIWQGWAASDADIANLALGISPYRYRPGGLVSYLRLSGDTSPETDLIIGGAPWTLNGAATGTANTVVTSYTSPGTFSFSPTPGATSTDVIQIGASGGSGSGASNSAGAAGGGGGSGGGGYRKDTLTPAQVGAGPITVIVGQGGTGGLAVSGSNAGNPGTAGTASSFAAASGTLTAPGGGGGGGGTSAGGGTGGAGGSGTGVSPGGNGGAGGYGAAGVAGGTATLGAGGGGGGGANARAGGSGGGTSAVAGGTAGNGSVGGAGSNGVAQASGGGGGGGSGSNSGTSFSGGAGGAIGGGVGGGGAISISGTSGAGVNGANGAVYVIETVPLGAAPAATNPRIYGP